MREGHITWCSLGEIVKVFYLCYYGGKKFQLHSNWKVDFCFLMLAIIIFRKKIWISRSHLALRNWWIFYSSDTKDIFEYANKHLVINSMIYCCERERWRRVTCRSKSGLSVMANCAQALNPNAITSHMRINNRSGSGLQSASKVEKFLLQCQLFMCAERFTEDHCIMTRSVRGQCVSTPDIIHNVKTDSIVLSALVQYKNVASWWRLCSQ